jgi:hypothetical protein
MLSLVAEACSRVEVAGLDALPGCSAQFEQCRSCTICALHSIQQNSQKVTTAGLCVCQVGRSTGKGGQEQQLDPYMCARTDLSESLPCMAFISK